MFLLMIISIINLLIEWPHSFDNHSILISSNEWPPSTQDLICSVEWPLSIYYYIDGESIIRMNCYTYDHIGDQLITLMISFNWTPSQCLLNSSLELTSFHWWSTHKLIYTHPADDHADNQLFIDDQVFLH